MLIYAILAVPLAAGTVAAVLPWRRWVGWVTAAANGAVLVLGVALAADATRGHPAVAGGGVLRADALSAFMVVVIGAIAVLASSQSVRYLSAETGRGGRAARHAALYTALVQAFVTCMLVAVLAANLGVMWVAVEATTIATTFLVGHRRTDGALEASWKYVVLCSVGIALAFLGTVLFYFAALHASGHPAGSLDWTSLMAASHRLDPGVVRLAMGLIVLGYGTKTGLAPMHSWLPDAHSQAPAPVSALMSGVLLTVAFYALLRFKAIADGVLGPGYPRALLVVAGLASLAVAASLLITQRDYKRMLAYHSIEHMGLIALGAAAGSSLAIAAVLLHILGHGLAKGVLFLASGEILLAEGTSEIAGVPALLSRRPVLGGIFGFGLVALLGPAAVQPVRQRAQHAARRSRRRPRLGRGDRPGLHGGHLRRGDGTRPSPPPRQGSTPRRGPRRHRGSSPSRSPPACSPARSSACPPGRFSRSCTRRRRSSPHEPGHGNREPPARPARSPRVSWPPKPDACSPPATGSPPSPPTTMTARSGSSTCSPPGRRTGGPSWRYGLIPRTPKCRPSPVCRSRPAGSSGRSTTCSGSSRPGTRSCGPWSCTSTGRKAGTRCAARPGRRRRCAPMPRRSRSCRSKDPAYMRSRSAPSMPGSSSPGTSGSPSSGRPS